MSTPSTSLTSSSSSSNRISADDATSQEVRRDGGLAGISVGRREEGDQGGGSLRGATLFSSLTGVASQAWSGVTHFFSSDEPAVPPVLERIAVAREEDLSEVQVDIVTLLPRADAAAKKIESLLSSISNFAPENFSADDVRLQDTARATASAIKENVNSLKQAYRGGHSLREVNAIVQSGTQSLELKIREAETTIKELRDLQHRLRTGIPIVGATILNDDPHLDGRVSENLPEAHQVGRNN